MSRFNQVFSNQECRLTIFQLLREFWCVHSFKQPLWDMFSSLRSKWTISPLNAVARSPSEQYWNIHSWGFLVRSSIGDSMPNAYLWKYIAQFTGIPLIRIPYNGSKLWSDTWNITSMTKTATWYTTLDKSYHFNKVLFICLSAVFNIRGIRVYCLVRIFNFF